VFVRANVTDNDGDVYRAAKWEKPETFDLYLQTPGTFPSFEEAFATLDEAFVEGKRFAEFAGCSLILELWDDTLEITPAQFHGIESAIIWEWLRARGWVGR
jgi:hypothetical protein